MVVLLGTLALAAPRETEGAELPIRLTVEVHWNQPAAAGLGGPPGLPASLELTAGRVLEAMSWAEEGSEDPVPSSADARWMLGTGRSGRVRARLEAPIGASLVVRAGGQVVQFPLLSILEGPQQTAPQVPVGVTVERLAWDALEVRLDDGAGTVAPGAVVPVTVGFNILTPEPTEVALRFSATLRPVRGGEPIWRVERSEIVATNGRPAPARLLAVPAPRAEGTYVLEIQSSWEPVANLEGTRLGRWWRRRRSGGGAMNAAERQVALAVLAAKPEPTAAAGRTDVVIDSIDVSRGRGFRPTASGRAPTDAPGQISWTVPEAACAEQRGRERRRSLIGRSTPEAAVLGPPDAAGLAWTALGLKVPHPGRPHRLTVSVAGGRPSALGVALVVPADAGGRPRLLLDACASGPAPTEGGPAVSFSWPVWPDADEPVLVLVNRGTGDPVRIAGIEWVELADDPPPQPLAETHPDAPRTLGLHLAGPHALDRFGGANDGGPDDPVALAHNLASYLAHCGATAVVLPEGPADRSRRTALDGQAAEDSTGPDRLDVLLRLLARQGVSTLLDVPCDGPLPGLPTPNSPEALERGLIRVDHRGVPDGPAYLPLHPDVRAALTQRIVGALSAERGRTPPRGVLIRLGPGPTLLGGPGTGLDDTTYARFVGRMFEGAAARGVPGLRADDPNRFAARHQFLTQAGRVPWLTWRCRELAALYTELAQAVRQAVPEAILAVATPVLDDGPAGEEARRADLAGLPPSQAWRAVGLDLGEWPSGPGGPVVLRSVGLTTDDLGHDLATSPDLDAQVLARSGRGLLLGAEARAESAGSSPSAPLHLSALPMAAGSAGDEPLGHALASLDARWVVVTGTAVAGQEDRLRRFARVFRALPAPADARAPEPRQPSGVAVRSWTVGPRTFVSLANDTPFPIRLQAVLRMPAAAPVDDMGRGLVFRGLADDPRGGKQLVLDLPPFGALAVRIGASGVGVVSTASRLLTDRDQAQFKGLSALLSRLSKGEGLGPPNPRFELDAAPRVAEIAVVRNPSPPVNWMAAGDPANALEIDPVRPRSGRGSLRLDARVVPASVVSDPFVPPGGGNLTLRTWLRSDPAEAPVRVRIEGELRGHPIVRLANLTAHRDWVEAAILVGDLPAEGLDRARIRFEMGVPGRLWIDDLSLAGPGPSDVERQHARSTLTAALQAYGEGRYADFARLAASHWVRREGTDLVGRFPEVDRDTPLRTGDASSSDLPPGRRLR
jgi:hypothetical protein